VTDPRAWPGGERRTNIVDIRQRRVTGDNEARHVVVAITVPWTEDVTVPSRVCVRRPTRWSVNWLLSRSPSTGQTSSATTKSRRRLSAVAVSHENRIISSLLLIATRRRSVSLPPPSHPPTSSPSSHRSTGGRLAASDARRQSRRTIRLAAAGTQTAYHTRRIDHTRRRRSTVPNR
jgi:hypothetical protein